MEINLREQIKWYAVYNELARMYPNVSIDTIITMTNKLLGKDN